MEKYFEADVVFVEIIETRNGTKEKKKTEKYLVKGDTPTIVEAAVYKFLDGTAMDFDVKSIKESKIIEVF